MARAMTREGSKGPLHTAAAILRFGDWWFWKVPPVLWVAYLLLLAGGVGAADGLVPIAALAVSVSFLAAYGHLLNDLCDRRADQRAGRSRASASLSAPVQRLLCALLALGAGLPWLLTGIRSLIAILLAAILFVATAYSVPPVRLKERGWLGVLADAAGVHALPTLLAGSAVWQVADGGGRMQWLLALATLWAMAYGIRGILIHQLRDLEYDRRAGTATLVSRSGPERTRRCARRWIFPIEIVAFLGLVLTAWQPAPFLAWLASGWVVFEWLRHRFHLRTRFDPVPSVPRTYVPPSDLYEVWFPLALITGLAVAEPLYLVLLAVHLALFYREVRTRARQLAAVARSIAGMRS